MRLLRAVLAAVLVCLALPAAAQDPRGRLIYNQDGPNVPPVAIYCDDGTNHAVLCSFNGGQGGGGDPSSTGTVGSSTAPGTVSMVGGYDGSAVRRLAVDSAGRITAIIYSLPAITGTVSLTGTLPGFASTPTFNLGTLGGAATAAKQDSLLSALGAPYQAGGALPLPAGAATAAKQPAIDTNGDLRVPTVTVTPFFVSIPAATSTEILPAQSSRIGYDIQCTGNVVVGISRTHATLTTSTPAAGASIDLVMPASSTPPQFVPAYVSKLGSTGYAASATACWGQSFAQQ